MEPPGKAAHVATTAPADASRARPLIGSGFVVLAVVAGTQPSFSLGANVLVLGAGGGLFWIGLARGEPGSSARLRRGARWWLVPVAALMVVESVTFGLGSDNFPTLSRITDPWLEQYAVRATAFLGWLAAFWGLVRR